MVRALRSWGWKSTPQSRDLEQILFQVHVSLLSLIALMCFPLQVSPSGCKISAILKKRAGHGWSRARRGLEQQCFAMLGEKNNHQRQKCTSGDLFFTAAWHARALEQRHESWQQTGFCFRDVPFAASVKVHPFGKAARLLTS